MAGTIKEQPSFTVTNALKMRFRSKCMKAESGCLIWIGTIQRHGYGAIKIDGRKIDAHQAAWRIANGGIPVPIGKLIRHLCNCRQCVNVEHLKCGTHAENMQDAFDNGLGEFMPRGEEAWNSVLTDELVRTIWAIHEPRKYGATQIARKLGLNRSTVSAVITGKSWRHLMPKRFQKMDSEAG